MKSMMGCLMLLFSATMALAGDYQIIPTEYWQIGNGHFGFQALVVDLSNGPMNVCNGDLVILDPKLPPNVLVACFATRIHGVTTIPPGPAAFSRTQFIQPQNQFYYPGVWRVSSGGMVTFCTDKEVGVVGDLYCATTKLP
jgi:hypothetical protein